MMSKREFVQEALLRSVISHTKSDFQQVHADRIIECCEIFWTAFENWDKQQYVKDMSGIHPDME